MIGLILRDVGGRGDLVVERILVVVLGIVVLVLFGVGVDDVMSPVLALKVVTIVHLEFVGNLEREVALLLRDHCLVPVECVVIAGAGEVVGAFVGVVVIDGVAFGVVGVDVVVTGVAVVAFGVAIGVVEVDVAVGVAEGVVGAVVSVVVDVVGVGEVEDDEVDAFE